MSQTIKRKLIWNGWARLAHALIALPTLVLLLTGWLIQDSPVLGPDAVDFHHYAAGFLFVGLLIRLGLLIGGPEHLRFSALIPKAEEWKAMWETLRFYLLLGKTPLPRWYAHNPLWKPFYLLVLLMLGLQLISGLLMPETPVLAGFYLPNVHRFWTTGILWFVGLHLIAVVWHDYVQGTDDVSAMIHGHRLFLIDPVAPKSSSSGQTVEISVDALRATAQKPKREPDA